MKKLVDYILEYYSCNNELYHHLINENKIIDLLSKQITYDDIKVINGKDSLLHVEIFNPVINRNILIPDNVVIDKIHLTDNTNVIDKILKLCVKNGTLYFPQIIAGEEYYSDMDIIFSEKELKNINSIIINHNITIDESIAQNIVFESKNNINIFLDCYIGKLNFIIRCKNSDIEIGKNFKINQPSGWTDWSINILGNTIKFSNINGTIDNVKEIEFEAYDISGNSIHGSDNVFLYADNININNISDVNKIDIRPYNTNYNNTVNINTNLVLKNIYDSIILSSCGKTINNISINNIPKQIEISGQENNNKYYGIPELPDDLSNTELSLSNLNLLSLASLPKKIKDLWITAEDKLTSLANCPKYVNRIFINNCKNLKSLIGAPVNNFDLFSISGCPKVTSLEGISKNVDEIKFENNGIKISQSEINKYLK